MLYLCFFHSVRKPHTFDPGATELMKRDFSRGDCMISCTTKLESIYCGRTDGQEGLGEFLVL